jgi:SAM-dependent methyltransferase
MIDLENLLSKVPEKIEFRNTTSKKFKRNVFEFFNTDYFKDKSCLEIGCANGHTTFILSKLFKQVYGINLTDTTEALNFCNENGSYNVEFFVQDVYTSGLPEVEVDVIMIDAVHTYEAVQSDIKNSLKLKSQNKKYFIFDDTGIEPQVLKSVTDYCDRDILKIVKKIGCIPGDKFHRRLYSEEGLICIEQ